MFSSDLFRKISLILAVALLPLTAFAASSAVPVKPVEIHMDSEVKVAGEQVVLGDVATIYARSLADFKALSSLVISQIPDDKLEVKLPASYLEARVRAALPPGTDFALRSPKDVVFRLERLGLGSQEIAAEITRLGRVSGKIPEGVEVEVQTLSGMDQLAGYKLAGTRIDPGAEMKAWKGDMSFKLTKADGAGAPPVWVRAKLRWFQQAWVASRNLMFTENPDPSQFALGKVEVTGLREDPVTGSAEELAGFLKSARIKRQIAANSPLLPSMLDRKPDAAAGSALRVVFVSESGVRVSADGSLLSPGSIGSDVKARLRSSKKIVTGKLVSQGLVEVSL
jgi:flagella basal body P-ring formation protein FlgA